MASTPIGPVPGDAFTPVSGQEPAIGASAVTPEADDAAGGPGAVSGAAAEIGSKAKAAVKDLADKAQASAPQVGNIKEQAQQLRGQAIDRARSTAEDSKTKAAGLLDDLGGNVHEIADKLRQSQAAPIADYVERIAGYAQGFAGQLRDKPVDELVGDVRYYARQNPAVAVGVAVALGFAFARFLKATAPASTPGY